MTDTNVNLAEGLDQEDVAYLERVGGILGLEPAEVLHVIVAFQRASPGGERIDDKDRDLVERYRHLWSDQVIEDVRAATLRDFSGDVRQCKSERQNPGSR